MNPTYHPATRAIHGATIADAHGSPQVPIYTTTTFAQANTDEVLAVMSGRQRGPFYTRYGLNPTILALEETMAAIEGAEQGLAFASGMAAITATFTTFGRDGVVIVGDVYGGTIDLLVSQLAALGIKTTFLLGHEVDTLADVLGDTQAGLVYFETPTNPTMQIFDLSAIAAVAHSHGALTAVDNTFASPINQQPLQWGVDVVVYSATKYLGGHSDITAGFVLGSSELMEQVWPWRKNFGSVIAPEVAALLTRSLATLPIRIAAHNTNAQTVAEALEADPRVATVLYPGLKSFHSHALAAQQMRGFGGMLTFEVAADEATTSAFADRLQLVALAPSLGGVESLATQPVTTTHFDLSGQERAQRGITPAMVRLSVGLEDPADIIADLSQALEVVVAS